MRTSVDLVKSVAVEETTTTAGTGAYLLNGPTAGYFAFRDAYSDGDSVTYRVWDGPNVEVVTGVFDSSANTLSRDTVLVSSADDTLINWSTNTRRIIRPLRSSFKVRAAFFDYTDTIYNWPAMLDSPTGSLSFWIYTSATLFVASGGGPTGGHSPAVPDGDIFGNNTGYIVAGGTESEQFISVGETRAGTNFPIAAITNANPAVITATISVDHINVGNWIQVFISGGQADWQLWSAAGGGGVGLSFLVLAVSGANVTIQSDTTGLSTFVAPSNPTKHIQSLYNQKIDNISSANPAVVTFAGNHDIPAGAVVFTFFINQTGWTTFNAKSLKVLSVTGDTLTLDFDSTGFPTYDSSLFGNLLALVQVYNSLNFSLSNTVSPHNEDFFSEHTRPIPHDQWVNVLASWDTNHPERSKVFQLFYGDTQIPNSPPEQDVSIPFNVAWSQPNDYSGVPWQISGAFFNGIRSIGILCFLAEFYLNTQESLDFTDPANRAKFHDANSKPVSLGTNGSLPTGNVPTLYQHIPDPAPDPYTHLRMPLRVIDIGLSGGMERGTNLADGITSSYTMVFSVWVWGVQARNGISWGDGNSIIHIDTDATVTVQLQNNSFNTFRFQFRFDPAGSNTAGLTNICVAVDTNHGIGSKIVLAYVNNVAATVTVITDDVANLLVDWAAGASGIFFAFGNGYWMDWWVAPNQYFDPVNKFCDGSGNPINLGATGSVPSGTAPSMFFHIDGSQPADDAAINLGTGGTFARRRPADHFRLLPPAAPFCKNNTAGHNLILGPAFSTFELAPISPSD